MQMESFNFLSKIAAACKISSQKFSQKKSFLIFFFFLEFLKLNHKAFFHLPSHFVDMNSRKIFGSIDVFSCWGIMILLGITKVYWAFNIQLLI